MWCACSSEVTGVDREDQRYLDLMYTDIDAFSGRESGIRRALGASDQRVSAEVARRVARLTAVGVVAGVLASSAGSRLLSSLVVGVQATDLWVVVSVALMLATISTFAAVVPILRATKIEPTEALQTE